MENQTQTTSSYTQKKRIVAFILLCIIFITGISIWYFISKKIEEKSVAVPISPARKLQILTEESAKTTISL